MEVAPSGRIYVGAVTAKCSNPDCIPTHYTGGTGKCIVANPLPGEAATISMKRTGSKTEAKLTAEIDEANKRFILKGYTKTWTSSFSTCCEEQIDTTLVRQGSYSRDCP